MLHKIIIKVLLVIGITVSLLSIPQLLSHHDHVAMAHAKSAKVLSHKKLKKRTVHATKGDLYTSWKLSKISHHMKNYEHTTLYRTKQATIRKTNGKKAIYQYVKSINGKVKGWIWRGYLKTGKAAKSKRTSININKDQLTKAFLKIVNKERKKRHAKSLKTEPRFMRLANQRAIDSRKISDIEHDNKDGQSYFVLEAPRFHIANNWLDAECLFLGSDDHPNTSSAKIAAREYLYHDASSNWGHRDALVNDESDFIGIGWSYDGYALYNAVITGHDDEKQNAYLEAHADDGPWTVTLADGTSKTVDTIEEAEKLEQPDWQ